MMPTLSAVMNALRLAVPYQHKSLRSAEQILAAEITQEARQGQSRDLMELVKQVYREKSSEDATAFLLKTALKLKGNTLAQKTGESLAMLVRQYSKSREYDNGLIRLKESYNHKKNINQVAVGGAVTALVVGVVAGIATSGVGAVALLGLFPFGSQIYKTYYAADRIAQLNVWESAAAKVPVKPFQSKDTSDVHGGVLSIAAADNNPEQGYPEKYRDVLGKFEAYAQTGVPNTLERMLAGDTAAFEKACAQLIASAPTAEGDRNVGENRTEAVLYLAMAMHHAANDLGERGGTENIDAAVVLEKFALRQYAMLEKYQKGLFYASLDAPSYNTACSKAKLSEYAALRGDAAAAQGLRQEGMMALIGSARIVMLQMADITTDGVSAAQSEIRKSYLEDRREVVSWMLDDALGKPDRDIEALLEHYPRFKDRLVELHQDAQLETTQGAGFGAIAAAMATLLTELAAMKP